jgi:hypothetical protein
MNHSILHSTVTDLSCPNSTRNTSIDLIRHVLGGLLSQQEAESLLAGQSLLAELIIRRESGGVGRGSGCTLGVLLLHGVDALAIGIEVVHEVHGGEMGA